MLKTWTQLRQNPPLNVCCKSFLSHMKHSDNETANLNFPPICNSNSKVKFNTLMAQSTKRPVFSTVCAWRADLLNCATVSILFCTVAHQAVAPTFISEFQPNKNATAEQQIINHSLTEAWIMGNNRNITRNFLIFGKNMLGDALKSWNVA
jgi:hypothetical protein